MAGSKDTLDDLSGRQIEQVRIAESFSERLVATTGEVADTGAIAASRKEGRLARDPIHYVTKHLQQAPR